MMVTLGQLFTVDGAVGLTPAVGHPASTPCQVSLPNIFWILFKYFSCQEACPEAPPASSCPPDPATIPDPGMEAETVRERISDFQLVIQFG